MEYSNKLQKYKNKIAQIGGVSLDYIIVKTVNIQQVTEPVYEYVILNPHDDLLRPYQKLFIHIFNEYTNKIHRGDVTNDKKNISLLINGKPSIIYYVVTDVHIGRGISFSVEFDGYKFSNCYKNENEIFFKVEKPIRQQKINYKLGNTIEETTGKIYEMRQIGNKPISKEYETQIDQFDGIHYKIIKLCALMNFSKGIFEDFMFDYDKNLNNLALWFRGVPDPVKITRFSFYIDYSDRKWTGGPQGGDHQKIKPIGINSKYVINGTTYHTTCKINDAPSIFD